MTAIARPFRLEPPWSPFPGRKHLLALRYTAHKQARDKPTQSDPAVVGIMTPSSIPSDSVLMNVILATVAIGLPVVMVLLIRFLWDRNVNLGRSKDLDKLIWQLHRIASAMEHQMNLSFPPVQPGTEEPRDLAYLKQIAVEPNVAAPANSTASTDSGPVSQHQAPSPPTTEPIPETLPRLQVTSSEPHKRAGVNSMFDL